jgi:hypothetical protein
MRYVQRVLVLVVFSLGAACGQSPIGPLEPTPTPRPLLLPPIQGIVREVNAGPIAKALILLDGPSFLTHPILETNLNGEFELQPSEGVCRNRGMGSLFVSSNGYFPRQIPAPACSDIPATSAWTTVIALQKVMRVAENDAVQTVLSNENLDFGSPQTAFYDYPCGPCVLISLPSVMTTQWEVTIEWSSNDRLSAWFEAADNSYDTVKLGEYASAPGESRISVLTPKFWRDYIYPVIKIGLPLGSRTSGGLPSPITVNVRVRRIE